MLSGRPPWPRRSQVARTTFGAVDVAQRYPLLVFVGVTDLKVVATQLSVRVYREPPSSGTGAALRSADGRADVQRCPPSPGLAPSLIP